MVPSADEVENLTDRSYVRALDALAYNQRQIA